jgi:type IV pilus assembly protein PilY1
MINRKAPTFLLGLFLTLYTGACVVADDTEIYTGDAGPSGGEPLVMFVIDYAPPVLGATVNCTAAICTELVDNGYLDSTTTTRLGMLQAVLKSLLDKIGGMKIGLMMSHNSENNCAGRDDKDCSGGGYILSGFKSITTAGWKTDANKAAFFTLLDNLAAEVVNGTTSHTFQGKELYFEFFRYLTGHDAFSSHLGWTDYGTDNSKNLSSSSDKYLLMRDIAIEGISFIGGATLSDAEKETNRTRYNTPGTYTSPITTDCQKIFTINFLKGVTNQESEADTAIKTGTKSDGAMESINLTGKYNKFETVLEYMNSKDFGDGTWGKTGYSAPDVDGKQNVTSYFVVDGSGLQTGHDWAKAGGTTAAFEWKDDPAELIEDLTDIFSQIISVSTTFTAASVPVSVLNRAQIVDNVYIALFQADPDNKKRWPGNVKRLKLDADNGLLLDANDDNAVGADGRILHSALTFWTDAASLPAANADEDEIEDKDGRAVKRGGAGQKIPGFINDGTHTLGLENAADTRTVYYEPGSGTALPALNVDDDTAGKLQSDLGAADLDTAKTLLKYIRGYDVGDEDSDTVTDEPRSWILGDPLHSRPLPINYGEVNGGTEAIPDIRLVFGANDGLFHMVRNTVASADTGAETWAFMPRATMGIISDLKENPATKPHPYGVDGAPSAYVLDANNDSKILKASGDKVWAFFGLRRGGRSYYALDVTTPDSPTFMWSIDNNDADFAELGYTFAQPRVGYMNWGDGKKPVVVFSGGYDMNKDSYATNDSMGRALFIVDAETGALVWKAVPGTTGPVDKTLYQHASLTDSIPSTTSIVDTDGDGLLDRGYVGDTGGRIWRFDMSSTDRANWKATVLASVGRHFSADAGNDRRFFHNPDFIQYRDDDGDYDAIVIGSGDRAHPKSDMTNVNYLYVIKDRDTTTGTITASTFTHDSFFDATSNCLQTETCTDTDKTDNLVNGWRMKLEQPGEKNLATPTTLAKKIFVTTYLPEGGPEAGECAPKEGGGRLYALSLDNATPVNDYSLDGDITDVADRYVELDSGGIPAEVVYVPFNRILKPDLSIENVGVSGRWKTYWYKAEN